MKLSMWIIKEWLAEYHPVSSIVEGRQSIEGVRFFTESTLQNERYVYISRVADVFPDSTSEEVLLMHGNDTMSITSDDVGEVFNSTLRVFEYFNDWEKALRDATKSATPEQDIIDACDDLFGPMFLMDSSFNLIAFTRRYSTGEVNPIWDDYILYENPSLETLGRMKQSAYVKLFSRRHDLTVYEEPKAAPYSYGIMTSYYDDDGGFIGQMAIASDAPITRRDLQLAETIKDTLADIRLKALAGSANSYAESLFLHAVAGHEVDDRAREKFLLLQNWDDADFFCMVQGTSAVVEKEVLSAFRNRLALEISDSVFTIHENKIIGIVREGDPRRLAKALVPVAQNTEMGFGISKAFNGLDEAPWYSEQAVDALRHGSITGESIACFHQSGLHFLTHSCDREYILRSLHPALDALIKHDGSHSSEYAKTLRSYLQNERSTLRTAERMFIHRNTVLYRVGRVLELYPVDLDDPYEREYLMTSFRMLD